MLATVLHRTTGYTGELILGDGTVLEFVNGQAGPASITFADAQSLTVMGYSVITADPPPPTNDPFDVKAASLVPAGHVLGDALRAALTPRVTRTGVISVSNATATGTLANAEYCWRVVVDMPVTPKRVRLRMRNYNIAAETTVSTGATFVPVYIGLSQQNATGSDTADYGTAPTQLFPGFTLPSDGSEYVSAWVDLTSAPLARGKYTLSFAYTGGSTSTGQAHGGGISYAVPPAAGVSSHVADTSGASFSSATANVPFDVRLEVESTDALATGLFIGDSLAGVGESGFTPHYARWPELYAKRMRHIAANVATGSQRFADWADTSKWRFQRAVPTNGFDYAVIMLGTNDIGLDSATLATMQTRFMATMAAVQSLGITRIFVSTIPPRSFTHSRVVSPAAAAATSITLADNLGASFGSRIGEGYTTDAKTLGTPTGTGPYVYSCSALTNAHYPGEVVSGSASNDNEQVRLDFNAYVRSQLAGVAGVIPADTVWANPVDPSIFRVDLVAADRLHPRRVASALLAAQAPVIAS